MTDAAAEWMIASLENHLEALRRDGNENFVAKIESMAVTARIVAKVLPGEPFDFDPLRDEGWEWATQSVISKALGIIKNQDQLLEHLGPAGPSMPADGLHPVIWGVASPLWNDGHYGPAVARAATFLNAHIQDRSTRTDLSDKDLMTQVFSPSPATPDSPRLRWAGVATEQTRKSMQNGILSYAQGVSMAIRNPSAHATTPVHKQAALERLAALSVLARWVDACRLETA